MAFRTFIGSRSHWSSIQIPLYLSVIIHFCQGYVVQYDIVPFRAFWPLCACVNDSTTGLPVFCGFVNCLSENYEYNRCELGDEIRIQSATVNIRLSDANCTFHDGTRDSYAGNDGVYGFENDVLWVDNGCRASFTLCYARSSFWFTVPSTRPTSTIATTTIMQRLATHSTTLDSSVITTKHSEGTEPNSDSTTNPTTGSNLPSAGTVSPTTTFGETTKQTSRTILTKQPSENTSSSSDQSYLTTGRSSQTPGETIESLPITSANYPASTLIRQNFSTAFASASGENDNQFAVIGIPILAVVVVLGFIIVGFIVWRKRHPTEDATVANRLVL